MIITFVMYRPGLAGGTRITARYAEELRKRGHKVQVVCLDAYPKGKVEKILQMLRKPRLATESELSPFLQRAGVPVTILPHERPKAEYFPDSDLIVATFWKTAHWVKNLPARCGKKVYFIQHHEIHSPAYRMEAEETYRMPLRKITISNWLRLIMAERYGDMNVSVIHNPVDHDQFYSGERDKALIPVVGFMYSTTAFKAVHVAVDAIEKARLEIPNLRVVSFGSEKPLPRLPLPAGTEYTIKPPQDKIRDIYAAADVWLCSSDSEGFGLPPVEAMACRTPVISTCVGAMPEIVSNGKNGYLVNIGDSFSMAKRIVEVLSLPNHRWRMLSEAASATARAHTWDDATNALEVELSKILSTEA